MRRTFVLWLGVAALAAANPFVLTFVNEFGFDGEGQGWVELHAEPDYGDLDLTNWILTTSTSACTFAYTLPYRGFLVVDSASLAQGTYGRGTFRLNPAGDYIHLDSDTTHLHFSDEVEFPMLPAGQGRAPLPSRNSSASVLNVVGAYLQVINWYIDSTPTLEQDNDDYSSVSGTVTWDSSRHFYMVEVDVSGPMGRSASLLAASGQTYRAEGLGAGRYSVVAHGWPGNVTAYYPESIDLGYSELLPNINLHFDPQGIEEMTNAECRVSNAEPTVLSGAMVHSLASRVVFDAMGRRVLNPKPGVYFVREAQAQAQAVRKIVVTR